MRMQDSKTARPFFQPSSLNRKTAKMTYAGYQNLTSESMSQKGSQVVFPRLFSHRVVCWSHWMSWSRVMDSGLSRAFL